MHCGLSQSSKIVLLLIPVAGEGQVGDNGEFKVLGVFQIHQGSCHFGGCIWHQHQPCGGYMEIKAQSSGKLNSGSIASCPFDLLINLSLSLLKCSFLARMNTLPLWVTSQLPLE